ncbi:DUF3797 domain-containing protein [Streptobacillus felis]|uniref:DUF3797 domain-containing protein n=1 Tax=Streptobacillus felis TaxID=1384509 RepID=A0A7Z0TAN3_9FUSO|nr:DUF3797 domain-containing protein [Streptobacillus felis]
MKEITKLGVDWYFPHPNCSNKRWSNENKMVIRFVPKRTFKKKCQRY